MYRIVLTKYKNSVLYSYQDDDRPIEIRLFTDKCISLNSIYNGRVSDIKHNIDASFVELVGNVKGFLPGCTHKAGENVLVQVERDGTKTKDVRLTEEISIAGQYCVVYLKKGGIKVSAKIPSDIRKNITSRLKQDFSENLHMTIIRTNACDADYGIVKTEILEITKKIEDIDKYSKCRTKSLLYKPEEEWLSTVKGVYRDKLDEIVTDDPDILSRLKECGFNSRFYEDNLLSLIKLYSLESRLKDATSKNVWLKCGGYLVIEPTEALVSIDVNSGKISTGKDKDETILKVNLEAASEVLKQLRLRNLSGIIIVDFINMNNAKDDATLLQHLRDEADKDPIKTQIHGITSLGLVEITRMKGHKTLYEQIRSVSDDAVVSGD